MVGSRCGILVNHEAHGGSVHHGQWLMFTRVECAGLIALEEVCFDLAPVLRGRREGGFCQLGWWWCATWALA